MEVEKLIEELKKLPKGSTIGTFDAEDGSISDYVCIYGKKDKVYTSHGEINIEEIEAARYSNQSKVSDYYLWI